METKPFILEIRNMNDARDVYRIHRAILREIYLAEFQSDLNKKTITLKIQASDRELAIDLIEGLGFQTRIVTRFTTGIEGIF